VGNLDRPFCAAGVLWLGKALPRQWISPGSPPIRLDRSPSSYGRVSFSIQADGSHRHPTIKANITLPGTILTEYLDAGSISTRTRHHSEIPGGGFSWPPGGIKLRLRSALFPEKKIASVTMGGKTWVNFNATEETVVIPTAPADPSDMQSIVATIE
jgi:hypothetical protein